MKFMRVSDYIIKYLKENEDIDTFFTLSGGGCIFLIDSLTNVDGVKYIATHHEQAASIAAEGYSRMYNKIGACVVTSGPGGTNAITGVLGAWLDSIPIIILSGQVNKEMTTNYTRLPLRQLGDQEFNIVESVKNMTKYAIQINDEREIKYHLQKACWLAKQGRPGPVWLDIPLNVQSAEIDPETLKSFVYSSPKISISDHKIDKVVEKIKNSKKPLIIVGNGIRLSGAVDEIKSLVTELQIPVISAVNGNDIINEDYEGYVGRFGTHAQICANQLLAEADLVISIGSRLYVRQIGYNFKSFAKNAFRIYVDIDEAELSKPTLFPDLAIQSDAKEFIKLVSKKITNLHKCDSDWFDYCIKKYKNTPKVLDRHRKKEKFVSHYYFIEKLSEKLSEFDHIVTSDGSANVVTMQVMKLKGNQRLITNTGNAPMGYGLPAAIGASANGTKIICIEGDGSLHLNIHELQTLKHYNLPVKLIVLNNDGYTSIKLSQKAFFKGKFVASEKSSGVSLPNFQKISSAYELPYQSIRSHSEIDLKLEKFLLQTGPSILEVFADPDEFHEPKVVAQLSDEGKFIPGVLENIKWLE